MDTGPQDDNKLVIDISVTIEESDRPPRLPVILSAESNTPWGGASVKADLLKSIEGMAGLFWPGLELREQVEEAIMESAGERIGLIAGSDEKVAALGRELALADMADRHKDSGRGRHTTIKPVSLPKAAGRARTRGRGERGMKAARR